MSRPNPTEYWNPRIEPARGPRYVVVDADAEVVAAVSDAARRDRTAVFEVVVDVGAVRSSAVAADYPDIRIGDDPVGPIADWPAGIW